MKNEKLKIVFFGSSEYVIPIIEVLRKNFDLKLVLTTEKNLIDTVPNFCTKNKIPYLSVTSLSNPKVSSQLLNVNCPLAVLADFGLIIPTDILNAFPKGIINIHPSLLPKYRGPTPVQSAILNGEKETGVSIMKLDEKVDHGPILAQEKEKVLDTDTSDTLYKRLFEKGANLLPKVLNSYIEYTLKPIPQNHKNATFTKLLTRESGFIDLSSPPSSEKLQNMINAYFPWPGVWTKLKVKSEKLKVIKFLPRNLIQVEGKKPVSYKDFFNGYPEAKQQLEKLIQQLV